METFAKAVITVVSALAIILVICLIFAVPVWLLWNWLMPVIFGLTEITLLQAAGLLLLSGFLFGRASTASK